VKNKIILLVGVGIGYVLGARAGRERYDQIAKAARSFVNDPKVKRTVDQAEDFVKDKAPEVAEFVTDNAKKVASKVSSHAPGSRKKSTNLAGTSTPTE
jgi:gas vesicle protein